MQKELFEVLAEAKSWEGLKRIEPRARRLPESTGTGWAMQDVRELAIHREVDRL